ncbi:MAG: Rhs element Vgr protein, partial [Cyclobacteriaceae bacterium]
MPVSPVNAKTDLITFAISVGGSPIDDSYEVLSISTSKFINRQPYANITFLDGSAAESDFKVSNKADFLPGAEIEIKAGYHSVDKTIFKGIITKHAVTASEGVSELRLECRDKAIKMVSGRKNAYYIDKKDSDIISTLIGTSGASAEVEATSYQHKSMIQFNATDWDFMLTRADANGQVVLVSDGKISVKKPDTSAAPPLVVSYGSTLLEFSAELDSESQLKAVKGYAWDSA